MSSWSFFGERQGMTVEFLKVYKVSGNVQFRIFVKMFHPLNCYPLKKGHTRKTSDGKRKQTGRKIKSLKLGE